MGWNDVPVEVRESTMEGTGGADVLHDAGTHGHWYLYGGNDLWIASAEEHSADYSIFGRWDHIKGGTGLDTISYNLSNHAIVADMRDGWAKRMQGLTEVSTDTFESIEMFMGSRHEDTIAGRNVGDRIWGGADDDVIRGRGGNDSILGDSGNDGLYGGGDDDTLDGGTGNDVIAGLWDDDTLFGRDGKDQLSGGTGNDKLYGGGHADTIHGASGNDRIEGGSGNDVLGGGLGRDTLVYTSSGGVYVDLKNGVASGEGADSLSGFERVETGSGHDWIVGTSRANLITSGAGDDTVLARGGDDTVRGGDGDDVLKGGESEDRLEGQGDDDRLYGEKRSDRLEGGGGRDSLYGGSDADSINGGGGNDLIRGGQGTDTVDGGPGADTFVWQQGDSGFDVIHGFDIGVDSLRFAPDFFAVDVTEDTNPEDVLSVFNYGSGAILTANTVHQGWTWVARFTHVDEDELRDAIIGERPFQNDLDFA